MSYIELERRMAADEYLAWEAQQPTRHEFVNGRVFAMVGASRTHNRIVLNITLALDRKLRPPCAVFANDLKVSVSAANAFYYPDVVVTCDPADSDPYLIVAPILMVEVLSPTTEHVDRHKKKLNYLKLSSLQTFALVAQDERVVEIYRRAGDLWNFESIEMNGTVELTELGLSLSLDEIYDRVDISNEELSNGRD